MAFVLGKVEARINEEAERATHYLDETTEPRIVEVNISFENIADCGCFNTISS